MRFIALITFILIFSEANAQLKKYSFSVNEYATDLIDSTEQDIILTRLDGFLANKNNPVSQNPFVYPEYAKSDINPFEFLFDVEREGENPNFYKPAILAMLPIVEHEQYVIKIAYMGADKAEAKLHMICALVAKKREGKYYFFNAIDYNTIYWNKKQVGSIKYIFPNKLNLAKAQQMNLVNKKLAYKFSIPIISVTYYRCDNPEQLLKMMGYDYIPNMYMSTSGGFAQSWHNTLLAGNNSELYVHELVHFYTNKAFPYNNRIINEGYATYVGGSGGWTLQQTKQFAKDYLNEKPNVDILQTFINFDRVQYGIPFTYIVSGLICRDIETKFGFKKIKLLFEAQNDEQYFKILQEITGVTKQTFPSYVKKLVYN